jgi:hypothetical protein
VNSLVPVAPRHRYPWQKEIGTQEGPMAVITILNQKGGVN